VEAGFAGAIKLAPIARTYLRVLAQRRKKGAFSAPCPHHERAKTSARWPLPGLAEAVPSTSSSADLLSAYEDLPRRRLWPPRHTIQINVLLCILKGFALAKPLCCRIK
jgi:hypothetical protein